MNNSKFLTHQDAAILNRNMVLNYIREKAPVSRTDIWENMGLSRASVTQIIKQLIEHGFVYETGPGESRGGRKPHYLEFNATARNIIVFDWHLKTLFLTDLNSQILYSKAISLGKSLKPEEFSETISRAVADIIKVQKLDMTKVIGVGVIMPGLIDPANGVIMLSSDLNWRSVAIKDKLENLVGIPVSIEADVNMHAMGEYLNRTDENMRNFVLIEVEDDGLGAALIIDGQIHRGSNNMCGEIGHISIGKEEADCSCGKKGCIEAYLNAVIRKKSNTWKEEAAYYIGFATSIVVSLLDPKLVVLSGSVFERGGEEIVNMVRDYVMKNILKAEKRNIIIKKSSMGHIARVKGICELIYEKNFSVLKC
jgi:predicted NBD/HSP70 family sugar kinase